MKPFKCIIFFMIFSLVGSIAKACEQSLLGKRSRSPEEFSETSQPPKKRQKRNFPCQWPGCALTFSEKSNQYEHEDICTKNPDNTSECPHCRKNSFTTIIQLDRHRKLCTYNPKNESFPCQWCTTIFIKKSRKIRHEKICTKNPDNLSECPHCKTNTFGTIGVLYRHIKSCKYKRSILEHKKFSCKWPHCVSYFSNKRSQKRHLPRCTKKPGNPSACRRCGKNDFTTVGRLQDHEKKCQKGPVTKIANFYSQTAQSPNCAAVNSTNSNDQLYKPASINPSPDKKQNLSIRQFSATVTYRQPGTPMWPAAQKMIYKLIFSL